MPADETDIGVYDLAPGANELKIQVTGRNPSSTNTYFGLDYIKLVPAN